ncbi:hypothetical protein DSS3P8_097 [Roseobacter phage DSS3P8]|nr:hypothetical protein DSS3P8_097 [Roseobacter phage DSS3P8]
MTSIDTQGFLDLYDDIAVEIVDSAEPNTDVDLTFSNRELSENICQAMDWEDFDLFETHDFQAIYDAADSASCLAYAFIAFLRWRVFTTASSRGVGEEGFNIRAATHSEYWYIKLVDRWNQQNPAAPQMKAWVN